MDLMDWNLSNFSSPPSADSPQYPTPVLKRTTSKVELESNGMQPRKSVKRRAGKACQYCHVRKVRCSVIENGAPCTNCRLDEVECVVSERKRKKYADTGR